MIVNCDMYFSFYTSHFYNFDKPKQIVREKDGNKLG